MRSSTPTQEVLFTGNLATPRRTVLGVLGLFERTDIEPAQIGPFLLRLGFVPIALEEPDIPISREQQLECMSALLPRIDPSRSLAHHAVEAGLTFHVTLLGTLGLSMMYAPSLRECLRLITSYAEMSWGHARLVVSRDGDVLSQSFVVEGEMPGATRADQEALRRYCATLDLAASVGIIRDVFGAIYRPSAVWLAYPRPRDHRRIAERLGCPVRFDAPETRLTYPRSLWDAVPVHANELVFRRYEKLTAQLARRLRTDVDLSEQVRRLLWMSSPPPDRDAVASMLALSPRTLARRLAKDGVRYGDLRREVQLERACDYLRNRALPVGEVATRLGFSDAAAFSRAFREWTGRSPSAWRDASASG